MGKKKFAIMITITLLIFLIVNFATATVIEYYFAKSTNRIPILALKSESVAKQYTKYTALFYNVYECYSGFIAAQGKKEEEPYCSRMIKYDTNDYYTNYHNIKISKKDFQLIFDVSSTFVEIDSFTTYQDLENSKLVATEYKSNLHTTGETKTINGEQISIEVFPAYVKANEYGDYEWKFQTENPEYYKCMKNNLFKDYDNGTCTGEWKELTYSEEWCTLAKETSFLKIKDIYENNCE